MTRARLDQALVARGLARSRTQAQQLVRAGLVLLDGTVATRPATTVEDTATVELTEAPTGQDTSAVDWITRGWVGRGAVKLQHALDRWAPQGLTVRDARCLDVGASTGGFTQVLLEHGARHVVALDVGHDQLAAQVRDDPRVQDLSGTSIRDVDPLDPALGGPFDVVVADLSFISLTLVLPTLAPLTRAGGHLVLLVKPQFEVGRHGLGKGGVVRSSAARSAVLAALDPLARQAGLHPVDLERSPVTGGSGNVEYLWWLRVCPPGMMDCGRTVAQLAVRREELRREEER